MDKAIQMEIENKADRIKDYTRELQVRIEDMKKREYDTVNIMLVSNMCLFLRKELTDMGKMMDSQVPEMGEIN